MKHLIRQIKTRLTEFLKWLWLAVRKLIPRIISYHKNKVDIYHIISITPNRMHAWVNSSVGRIKKPTHAIPLSVRIAWNEKVEKEINSIELPFVAPHVGS